MLDLDALAAQMLHDYDRHAPGTPFADGLRLSIDEAYRLQSRIARRRQARGERVVGYKIGCVAPVNQARHGLSHPVWGRLWSSEQHPSGATLPQGDFANLAVEAELGVTLGRDLGPDARAVTDVVAAVAHVMVAVELHNLVLRGGDPTGPELIANNAIHAGVVSSPAVVPPPAGTQVDLALESDGATVDAWSDRRWPDDVLAALPWLARELARHGRRLEAGQLVLVGAWGPPRPVRRPVLPEGGDPSVARDDAPPASDRTRPGSSTAGAASAQHRVTARSRTLGIAEATLIAPTEPASARHCLS
ncbi:MAG: fumarylacetoacetate hydrolase family protein [Acidobacteria bacterium]|nr:fumarylacetoacetate hydrolase family protein [Acidobacteriota bacterium]